MVRCWNNSKIHMGISAFGGFVYNFLGMLVTTKYIMHFSMQPSLIFYYFVPCLDLIVIEMHVCLYAYILV